MGPSIRPRARGAEARNPPSTGVIALVAHSSQCGKLQGEPPITVAGGQVVRRLNSARRRCRGVADWKQKWVGAAPNGPTAARAAPLRCARARRERWVQPGSLSCEPNDRHAR